MNGKQLKKILSIISIVSISITCILGICQLISILPDSIIVGNIFLTLLTIVIACCLMFNSVYAIEKKNKFGYASSGLLGLSAFLVLLVIWIPTFRKGTIMINIAIWISALSIFFNILINNYIKLGKKLLPLQIISYVLLGYLEFALCCMLGDYSFTKYISTEIVLGIVALLWITLNVILLIKRKDALASNKQNEGEIPEGMMLISKEEYQRLLDEIETLKKKKNN